jgi:prevent-host-death family protein
MDSVGIRELKAHLSHYLKRVRSGARLTVTERGRSIATISPVETPPDVGWAHRLVPKGGPAGAEANPGADDPCAAREHVRLQMRS